jgi:hypothetical protein
MRASTRAAGVVNVVYHRTVSLPFAGLVVVWSGDKPRHDV